MPTDGADRPRSICEIRLAEQPTRRASSRTDRPRSSRTWRSRGPSPAPTSKVGAIVSGPVPDHGVNLHCTGGGPDLDSVTAQAFDETRRWQPSPEEARWAP